MPLADALIVRETAAGASRSGVERVVPNALSPVGAEFSLLGSTRSTTSSFAAPDPGLHNQAMMELGATVCLRKSPRCPACPVARFCAARRSGAPETFPRVKSRKIERREVARGWCEHKGRLLLRRGHARAKRLAGLHELPEMGDLGIKASSVSPMAVKRRTITRYQITESIFRVKSTVALRKLLAKDPALEWTPLAELDCLTLSGPHKRWIQELRKL